jgi:hypothetical protein
MPPMAMSTLCMIGLPVTLYRVDFQKQKSWVAEYQDLHGVFGHQMVPRGRGIPPSGDARGGFYLGLGDSLFEHLKSTDILAGLRP